MASAPAAEQAGKLIAGCLDKINSVCAWEFSRGPNFSWHFSQPRLLLFVAAVGGVPIPRSGLAAPLFSISF